MALGVLKLEDPTGGHGERRHRVRHRLHTPVYASFSGPHTGLVLDLSELLDLHEDGFAVQANEPLEINRPLNICLDLPETKSYVHASGHVVWSDGRGRGGVSFSGLSEDSRRRLKEWLFVNALIACTHQAARSQQRSQQAETLPPEPLRLVEPPVPAERIVETLPTPVSVPDLSGLLSAVDAVRLEVRALEGNFDAALQLVTERALSLTGASGAALAFSTEGELVCRARAGDQAPPLGSRVNAREGLTGECVRSGRLISCEDTEIDPRVDRELCRQLGIGSILAVPILSDFKVAGLIEVFSPQAHAFAKIHATVMDRLAELVPKEAPPSPTGPGGTGGTANSVNAGANMVAVSPVPETETAAQEPLTGVGVRRVHLGLLVVAVAFSALALGYVLAPTIERHWLNQGDTRPAIVSASAAEPTTKSGSKGNTLADVRTLAESGDPGAQYELGTRYHYGDGVTQSDPEAVKWFIRAAEQGHVVSQATLGYFYWVGQGVPRDVTKAYFWSVLARAGGDEASKYRVESLGSNMTRAQAIAIQQEADMWLHEHSGIPPQSTK